MSYKVHLLDVKNSNMQEKLELFINQLNGKVISIIPNVRPALLILGGSAKIDFLLIVESTD